ncbi:MAG: hypothetical protein CM1200mP30_28380 [Pseudomonadota bacterium]|nr:MAG: hypothetical protein CM1200mP30_28380 [Pseudomonadota bacterium]
MILETLGKRGFSCAVFAQRCDKVVKKGQKKRENKEEKQKNKEKSEKTVMGIRKKWRVDRKQGSSQAAFKLVYV